MRSGPPDTTDTTGETNIGTASPASPLDVVYGNNNFLFGVNVRNTSAGAQALVGFGLNNAGGARVGQFAYVSPTYTTAALRDTVLFSSAGATSKLAFVSSADGTGSPGASYKLDVAGAANVGGNLNVTGNITGANIQATYQDVAE